MARDSHGRYAYQQHTNDRSYDNVFNPGSAPNASLNEVPWAFSATGMKDIGMDSNIVESSPQNVASASLDRSAASQTSKAKAPRASVACRACRTAKSKCDENPRCGNCTTKNIECIRDIPPPPSHKPENLQQEIIVRLNHLMESHDELIKALNRTVPELKNSILLERGVSGVLSETHTKDSMSVERGDYSRGNFSNMSWESTIPSDHTTAAAKVLQWPAVANVARELFDADFDPMKQELELHPIMVDKMGTNLSAKTGHQFADVSFGGVNAGSNMSPAGSSSSSLLPGRNDLQNSPSEYEESFKLDEFTVKRLAEAYWSTMGAMHPVIEPKRFSLLMSNFLDQLPDMEKLIFGDLESMNSRKRKRQGISHSHWNLPDPVDVTMVLLVLSLGAVCEYREHVSRNASMVTSAIYQEKSTAGDWSFSDSGSPELGGHTSLFPPNARTPFVDFESQREPELRSRASDMINGSPGLTFFAAAMKLYGASLAGGNTLQHVHANLLAGLYCGQLARVLESHAHYSSASRALYMILNPRRAHLEALMTRGEQISADDNQYVITFWTCLQLESDILAELDVPQSPILAWESSMPWPDVEMATKSGLERKVVECYIAQLWLRKRLNQIHSDLYAPHVQEKYSISSMNHLKKLPVIESLRDSLEGSNVIAPSWAWDPEDPPATNILAARLRAKYYGGCVIVYRPFLRMVLNNGLPGAADDIELSEISPLIMNYAVKGVEASIKSSQAFQNVEGWQFIVTNPWGTAYAQWANTLILLAAYQHPILRQHVTFELLQDLSQWTLRFVASLNRSSIALNSMHEILESAVSRVLSDP